nr:MAG TPA: MqsA [Caudoviricetes sp.]
MEENNCPYCQGNELLFKRNNVKIWVAPRDKEIKVFIPKERINAWIDVKYCPMCGKKL